MSTLGVVPARGGSKGIPRKNLALLAGRPLLEYTAQAAAQAQLLERLVLSTDDPEIAAVGRDLGLEVPFARPSELATDETPMVDVLRDLLARLASADGYEPDAVVLLQPTSPLRRASHIDSAVELFRESDADSVVTVVEIPHAFNPVSALQMVDGRLSPYLSGPTVLRRQDKPQVFARNGPAVLVVRRTLIEQGTLYGQDVRALIMSVQDSVDIDTFEELEYAEFLLSRRNGRRS